MKTLMTILGVFAIGEGLILILKPKRYLRFWVQATHKFADWLRPGLIQRSKLARLLGLAELVFGLWLATQYLEEPEGENSPATAG